MARCSLSGSGPHIQARALFELKMSMDQKEFDRMIEKTLEKTHRYGERFKNVGKQQKNMQHNRDHEKLVSGYIEELRELIYDKPEISGKWRSEARGFLESMAKGDSLWPFWESEKQNWKFDPKRDLRAFYFLWAMAYDKSLGTTYLTQGMEEICPEFWRTKEAQYGINILGSYASGLIKETFFWLKKDLEKCGLLPTKGEGKSTSEGENKPSIVRLNPINWNRPREKHKKPKMLYEYLHAVVYDEHRKGVPISEGERYRFLRKIRDSMEVLRPEMAEPFEKFYKSLHFDSGRIYTKIPYQEVVIVPPKLKKNRGKKSPRRKKTKKNNAIVFRKKHDTSYSPSFQP